MTYQQLELLLAGPGELHGPDPVGLADWHGENGLLAGGARGGSHVQESLGVVGNAVAEGAEVVEREEDAGLGAAAAAQEKQQGRRHSRQRERQAHGHLCAD